MTQANRIGRVLRHLKGPLFLVIDSGRKKTVSYPALGANVVHLVVGALADPLAAPQFTADFGVRVAHGADRKEVGDDHERHVVSAMVYSGQWMASGSGKFEI